MDMENTFAKKVQKAMGSAIPDWIPRASIWIHGTKNIKVNYM